MKRIVIVLLVFVSVFCQGELCGEKNPVTETPPAEKVLEKKTLHLVKSAGKPTSKQDQFENLDTQDLRENNQVPQDTNEIVSGETTPASPIDRTLPSASEVVDKINSSEPNVDIQELVTTPHPPHVISPLPNDSSSPEPEKTEIDPPSLIRPSTTPEKPNTSFSHLVPEPKIPTNHLNINDLLDDSDPLADFDFDFDLTKLPEDETPKPEAATPPQPDQLTRSIEVVKTNILQKVTVNVVPAVQHLINLNLESFDTLVQAIVRVVAKETIRLSFEYFKNHPVLFSMVNGVFTNLVDVYPGTLSSLVPYISQLLSVAKGYILVPIFGEEILALLYQHSQVPIRDPAEDLVDSLHEALDLKPEFDLPIGPDDDLRPDPEPSVPHEDEGHKNEHIVTTPKPIIEISDLGEPVTQLPINVSDIVDPPNPQTKPVDEGPKPAEGKPEVGNQEDNDNKPTLAEITTTEKPKDQTEEGIGLPAFEDPTHKHLEPSSNISHPLCGNKKVADKNTMDIHTDVSFRLAKTTVTQEIYNPHDHPIEETFLVAYPSAAYISNYHFETCNKDYESYVIDITQFDQYKETHRQLEFIHLDRTIGNRTTEVLDTRYFHIKAHIKPQDYGRLVLSYVELLHPINRKQSIITYPSSTFPLDKLRLEIQINEPEGVVHYFKLKNVKSHGKPSEKLAELMQIKHRRFLLEAHKDVLQYEGHPPMHLMEIELEYNLHRIPQSLYIFPDHKFMHFFSPGPKADSPRHAIFVLDTSSSMDHEMQNGKTRLDVLKASMAHVLQKFRPDDIVDIIAFNHKPVHILKSAPATKANIFEAIQKVMQLTSSYGTVSTLALTAALECVDHVRNISGTQKYKSYIMFVTDGKATDFTETNDVVAQVTSANVGIRDVSIYSMGLGTKKYLGFLQKLSTLNYGHTAIINDERNAVYKMGQILEMTSKPVISDVKFKYAHPLLELSRTEFPGVLFTGNELIVCGTIPQGVHLQDKDVAVEAKGQKETIRFQLSEPIHKYNQVFKDFSMVRAILIIEQNLYNTQEPELVRRSLVEATDEDKLTQALVENHLLTPKTMLLVDTPGKQGTISSYKFYKV